MVPCDYIVVGSSLGGDDHLVGQFFVGKGGAACKRGHMGGAKNAYMYIKCITL